jgi:hypothetical protein
VIAAELPGDGIGGVALVVFERRSDPPCRSVIVIPHKAPRPYAVEVSRGSHSAERSGADARSAGTAAWVIETGQPWPASTCDAR